MNDNAEPDFSSWSATREPILCVTLPLKGGTELCVKVADDALELPSQPIRPSAGKVSSSQ